MRIKVIMTSLALAGLLVFSAVTFDEASRAAEDETSQPAVQQVDQQASRDAAAVPNAQVNTASTPATEQVNAAVAYSDLVIGEVYGVWTEYSTTGASPTFIGWSPSFGSGAPGTWAPVPVNPPPTPFQSEWNPDLASNPLGGYMMVSTGYTFPPYVAGTADGIYMTPTPGGGAPFAGPVQLGFNLPPTNWVDYPVITFDEGAASPNFGTAHIAWTEYLDLDLDPDGNGNWYDDPGDSYVIWTSYSGGAFPFPGFSPPLALGGGGTTLLNSMQMHRASIAVSHSGTPAMPFPGAVYVAWMDPSSSFIMLDASELVTAGVGWGALGAGPIPTVPYVPVGPAVGALLVKAASSVSLAIHNQPGSPCDGNIYLAWAGAAGGNIDIKFSSSVDGGITWSPPITVHPPDPPAQWAPSMTVDPVTGHICVVYLDERTVLGLYEVWVSISLDCGVTWRDMPLSDAGPTPPNTSIVTSVAPYIGDYLSSDVTATGAIESGIFGGIWNDSRLGSPDQDVFFDPDGNCCNTDGIRGDADNDCTFGCITVGDLSYLVSYLFSSGPAPLCPEEGNADGSCAFGCITVSDLSYLVNYLFSSGPLPPACP